MDEAIRAVTSGWSDEEVYRRQAPRLMAVAAALTRPALAEDVVSAAVVRAMSSPRWSSVRDPGAYLTRAVVNEARSMHRSSKRRVAREERWVAAGASPPGTDEVETSADPALRAVLVRLPLRQRAVIVLTYWADLAPIEVAAELGISEGSVRKHPARARATLREELS